MHVLCEGSTCSDPARALRGSAMVCGGLEGVVQKTLIAITVQFQSSEDVLVILKRE
jgi:hypothetical protein